MFFIICQHIRVNVLVFFEKGKLLLFCALLVMTQPSAKRPPQGAELSQSSLALGHYSRRAEPRGYDEPTREGGLLLVSLHYHQILISSFVFSFSLLCRTISMKYNMLI